jgi:DNA-binding protein H-NS
MRQHGEQRSYCKVDVSESKGVWTGRGVEEVERVEGKRGIEHRIKEGQM